jgi:fucose permease
LAVALLSQPSRRQLEDRRSDLQASQARKTLLNSMTGPLRLVFGDQHLRRLGLSSFAYSSTQICFVTFLVSYFHLELKQSISFAALVLAGSQIVSTVGRVFGAMFLIDGYGLVYRLACWV